MQSTRRLSVRQDGNPEAQTALSVPRRSVLGGIASAFGLVAAQPTLADVLPQLVAQPHQGRLVQAAAIYGRRITNNDIVLAVHASAEYAENSFHYAKGKVRDSDLDVCPIGLSFPGTGRYYIAMHGSIDLAHNERFEPRHLLDVPTVPAVGMDPAEDDGRLWDGFTACINSLEAEDFLTRDEALAKVAHENALLLEGDADDWLLPDGYDWWAVLELGAKINPVSLYMQLGGGVGSVTIEMELACRLVVPTAAEVVRYGKAVTA